MVVVRHERADAETSFEVRVPLGLGLPDGTEVRVVSWSLEGIRLEREFDLPPQKALLIVPFQGFDISFQIRLQREPGSDRLNFVSLTPRQRELLSTFHRAVLSGRMASVDDTIASLDTPVDLISMEETQADRKRTAVRGAPRWLRAALWVPVYLALAWLIFGVVGGAVYERMTRTELGYAQVVAPLEPQLARNAGIVSKVAVVPGQHVARGDVVIELTDPSLEGEIAAINRSVAQRERDLSIAMTQLRQEERAFDRMRSGLEADYRRALDALWPADLFAGRDLEAVTAAWDALAAVDRGLTSEARALRTSIRARRSTVELAERRLADARTELEDAMIRAAAWNIRASTDGVVTEVIAQERDYLGRGEVALVIEADLPRQIAGWVVTRSANRLHVGAEAEFEVAGPVGTTIYPARVVGLVVEPDKNLLPDRAVRVMLEATGIDVAESRELFIPGSPVAAIAVRGPADP